MISLRNIAFSVFGAVLTASPAHSQDLSRYRDFQLGANLTAVAKQAQVKPSEAKAIHQRPALIQELEWKAQSLHAAQHRDPIKLENILFSFYNGELFRLVVTYDRERVEGMSAQDLVDAISAKYGTADRSAAEITISSTHLLSDGEKLITDRSEKVVARWEDSILIQSLSGLLPIYFWLDCVFETAGCVARAAIVRVRPAGYARGPSKRERYQEEEGRGEPRPAGEGQAREQAAFSPLSKQLT